METGQDRTHRNNAGDHLANERTFLAWIRTGIGIMGFGFAVVKFSLFVKQVTIALGDNTHTSSTGSSPAIGILLVTLGTLVTLFSYLRYSSAKKQLEQGEYYQSSFLIKGMTAVIFIISVMLIIYLLKSI